MINNQVIGHIIHEAVMESDANIIAERNGKAYATGPIQDLETENRNGRIYTKEEMEPEVYSDRIQKELIPTGNMRGHDGHPSSQDLAVQSVIDPKLCSVQFDRIWIEGNIIHANYHGTNNELGRAFNLDLLEGCKLSFSLRALGSIDRSRNGKCYVRNPRVVTWDRVMYPSHKIAYTDRLIDPKTASGKLHESALITESAALSGTIIPVLNSQVVSYIKHESANIQSILNTFDVLYESAIICNNGRNVTLKLKSGDTILVNLEQYIQDEIMNYCYNK